MRKTIRLLFCTVFLTSFLSGLQAQVPGRPLEQRLVNDFSKILTANQIGQLEGELVAFDNATSTQVCVVTVPDLQGEDINMAAYRILSEWGIGSAENNNGAVILVEHRPGTLGGRVAISVGYGLEGVLTDALSKRIITYDMIPFFKEGDYYHGIRAGATSVMEVVKNEYDATDSEGIPGIVAFFMAGLIALLLLVVIIAVAGKKKGPTNLGGNHRKGPSLLELMILANLLGGKSRNSGSRSGTFGGGLGSGGFGGGGGFGGFGGGLGGGGGASGSW
ncbi:MAG: TPM domain-containing protein [Bacteroidales bacterium]|nr:TPM domain-containing protein [Bacteroidales bacterium]